MTGPAYFSTFSYLSKYPKEIGVICPGCKQRTTAPLPDNPSVHEVLEEKTEKRTCHHCKAVLLVRVSATLSIEMLARLDDPASG